MEPPRSPGAGAAEQLDLFGSDDTTSDNIRPSANQGVELRPYQRDVIDRIHANFAAGRRRMLLVAPTGSGKTVIAAAIIAAIVGKTPYNRWQQ